MIGNLVTILGDFWGVLGDMAPYLLFGFFVAGILSVVIAPRFIERHLGRRGLGSVFKSALFGVPLPLCSCGVIPVGASLRRHGASKAATTAFLISTPQTGVDSIMVTFSLLGGVYAVFRPIFALLSGVIGGSLVGLLAGDRQIPAKRLEPCRQACCAEDGHGRIRRAVSYGFLTLPGDIGKALLVGLVIAALISALVPEDFFAPVLGGGIAAMLLMMLLGIPVYVCATASVPIAAALIARGVSPGAAFVFLMTGPATNAATIATIWKIMGRRTAAIYLLTVAGAALAGGLILDRLVDATTVEAARQMAWMLPGYVRVASAVILLALLAVAIAQGFRRRPGGTPHSDHAQAASRSATLEITGMTCSHCAETIRRAMLECPGVESAKVDLNEQRAVVTGQAFDVDALRRAIIALGYGLKDPPENAEP